MSTPPPPPPGEPYDPNQPHGSQPPPYGQQPSEGYASYPPPYAPPPQGGYGQQPENHPRATTALVLGIVGLVCCGIAAPFAWVIGKKTMDEVDASQGRIGGRGLAQAGYILGIVGTVLLALSLVALVFAIAVGGFTFEAGTLD